MYRGIMTSLVALFATALTSTNYTLNSYDLGSGAGSGSGTTYHADGEIGGSAGSTITGGTYALPAGVKASQSVPVPQAPTLTDDDSAYDRLHLTLASSSVPTDTKYLIAISSDNFVTTKYVQLDHTIGTTAGITNYQTYSAWGGASGFMVIGLNYNTTYKVKVAALQGSGTGSGFGPTANATTTQPSVSFGLSTSLTSTPPFIVTFTSLPAGSVVTGNATINLTLTTNAANGGGVMVTDKNAGLSSAGASYTIASASADLTPASSGYGAQVTSASQTSGGPLTSVSPFNGTSNNVGALTTGWQSLVNFTGPITGGSLVANLLAKSNSLVPAETDYSDTLTVSIAPLF